MKKVKFILRNSFMDDTTRLTNTSSVSNIYTTHGSALLMLLIVIVIGMLMYFLISPAIFEPSSTLEEQTRESTKISEGDVIAMVEDIIKNRGNIDAMQNEYAQTLLHIAAKKGYVESTRMLIENDSKIDPIDSLKGTPLHRAVQNGHVEVAEILIENGANIEARYATGATPIYFAINAKTNKSKIMKLILNAGASVNVVNSNGTPPLGEAISIGDLKATEILIEHGADIHFRNEVGTTLLHKAAYLGKPKIAELLIKNGADMNARDKDGKIPLEVALSKPFPGVSKKDKDRAAEIIRKYMGKKKLLSITHN